ncbi:MAG: hypothetical protein N3F05_03720 [Candidatus Diapherotrites archaeon]|nr:hypothetical protein [Candidatus Diapherotrites archaeon]
MAMKQCPKCGSIEIEKGRIISGKRVVFKGETQNPLEKGYEITPYACKSCGFTKFYTEMTKKGGLSSIFKIKYKN